MSTWGKCAEIVGTCSFNSCICSVDLCSVCAQRFRRVCDCQQSLNWHLKASHARCDSSQQIEALHKNVLQKCAMQVYLIFPGLTTWSLKSTSRGVVLELYSLLNIKHGHQLGSDWLMNSCHNMSDWECVLILEITVSVLWISVSLG